MNNSISVKDIKSLGLHYYEKASNDKEYHIFTDTSICKRFNMVSIPNGELHLFKNGKGIKILTYHNTSNNFLFPGSDYEECFYEGNVVDLEDVKQRLIAAGIKIRNK